MRDGLIGKIAVRPSPLQRLRRRVTALGVRLHSDCWFPHVVLALLLFWTLAGESISGDAVMKRFFDA